MEKSPIIAGDRQGVLRAVETNLKYKFRDMNLLNRALTHRSFANENTLLAAGDNERLEFMGDAVLGLVVTDLVMRLLPDFTEGQMTKLRASLVNEQYLSELARQLSLGEYLLIGKGEEQSGGRDKNSVLANTLEALFAAVYLDAGFDETRKILQKFFLPAIEGKAGLTYRDYKTGLQELCHTRFQTTPVYILMGAFGPDHERTYQVGVSILDNMIATGRGGSKKEAEQQAARMALEELAKG